MPLGKWDRFKQGFGSYSSTKLDDWRNAAESALAELEAAVKAVEDPPKSTIETVIDTQSKALAKTKRDQDKDRSAATKAYAAIETACVAQLKVARTALKTNPPSVNTLKTALQEPGGKAFVDALVASIGDRASTDEQKDLIRSAIKARYDVKTLTGTLTTKALPRLYKMLGTLPEDHTHGNPKLHTIKREKNGGKNEKGKTIYSASYGNSTVTLEAGEAGSRARKVPYTTDEGSTKVKFFDAAVLHEVGHAIDDRDNVMDSAPNKAEFGLWREETEASIIEVAGKHMGFYKAFDAAGKPLLKGILESAFNGGDAVKPSKLAKAVNALHKLGLDGIARDPGFVAAARMRTDKKDKVWGYNNENDLFGQVKLPEKEQVTDRVKAVIKALLQADPAPTVLTAVTAEFKPLLDQEDAVDWDALAKHPAIAWLADIGGQSTGNWKRSNSKITAAAVKVDDGERVYQQSYFKTFWSYRVEARPHMVRNYQFRARGEWFAEAYTAYFLGLMGSGHTAHSWLKGLYGDPPVKQ